MSDPILHTSDLISRTLTHIYNEGGLFLVDKPAHIHIHKGQVDRGQVNQWSQQFQSQSVFCKESISIESICTWTENEHTAIAAKEKRENKSERSQLTHTILTVPARQLGTTTSATVQRLDKTKSEPLGPHMMPLWSYYDLRPHQVVILQVTDTCQVDLSGKSRWQTNGTTIVYYEKVKLWHTTTYSLQIGLYWRGLNFTHTHTHTHTLKKRAEIFNERIEKFQKYNNFLQQHSNKFANNNKPT